MQPNPKFTVQSEPDEVNLRQGYSEAESVQSCYNYIRIICILRQFGIKNGREKFHSDLIVFLLQNSNSACFKKIFNSF